MLSQIWVQFNREIAVFRKKLRAAWVVSQVRLATWEKELARIPPAVTFLIALSSFAAYYEPCPDNMD